MTRISRDVHAAAPAARHLNLLARLGRRALVLSGLGLLLGGALLPTAQAQDKTELRIGYQKSASLFVL